MEINNKKPLHPNIILLGIVSMLNDISSEMIAPILPLLITSIGGTGVAIGLIGGLRELVPQLVKIISGHLSDKIGKRKAFIYAGYGSSAFFKGCLWFARTWHQAFLFIGLERMGKGIRNAPRDALITESAPQQKGKSFGINRALDTLGAIFGSIITLVILWHWKLSLYTIIIIAALISFLSLIPIYWVQETAQSKPLGQTPTYSLHASIAAFPSSLKIFMLIANIFSLANFSYMFFMLKARDAFITFHPTLISILLYIFFNIFYTIAAIPLGILSDRIGRLKLIGAGYLLFGLTTFGFIFATSFELFTCLFILYGIALALIDVNQKAFISDLSPQAYRATVLGTFDATTGIAAFIGGLGAGYLWEVAAHHTIFLSASILSIGSLFLLILLRKRLLNQIV